MTFTAPFDEGSAITKYTVTATDTLHAFNGGQICSTPNGTTTTCTVTGLTNGDSYTFTVGATNANGLGAVSAPSNSVTPTTLQALTSTSAASTSVAAGKRVNFAVSATGNPAALIGESGALPSWLTFKAGKAGKGAKLTGLSPATSGGAYTFTLEASNGVAAPVYQTFTVSVLQITSPTTATADAGQPFTFNVTTSDAPANPVLTVSGLASGLHFVDNHNGTGVITGPATGQKKIDKVYHATVTATAGTVVARQKVAITVHL